MEDPGLGVGYNLAVNFGALVKPQPPDDDEADSVDQMSNTTTSYPIQVFPNTVYNNGENIVPCMGLQKIERDDPGYMDCSNNQSTTSTNINNNGLAIPILHPPEPLKDVILSSEDYVVTCNNSIDNGAQGSQQCIGTGQEDPRKEQDGETDSSPLVLSLAIEDGSNIEISADNMFEKDNNQINNDGLVEPVDQTISIENEDVYDSDNSCIIDITGRSSEEQSVDVPNVPTPVGDIQVVQEDAEMEEGEIVEKYDQHHHGTSSEMFLSQMRFFGGRTWARGLGKARGRGRAKGHHGRRGKDVTNIALKLIETDQEALDIDQSTAVENNQLPGNSETGENTSNLENSSLTASQQTTSFNTPETNISSTMLDEENITETHHLNTSDSNDNLDKSLSTTDSMLKKGRGKAPLPSYKESKPENTMVENAAKRKRGRPPMQSKTEKTMAESAAKRGRGRLLNPVKDLASVADPASDDEATASAIQASLEDVTKIKSVTEGSSDNNHTSSEESSTGHKSVKTKMNSSKLKEIVEDIQNKWKGNSLLSEPPKETVSQTLSSEKKGGEKEEEEEEEEEEYESNDEEFQAAIKASLEELEKEKQRELKRNDTSKGKKNATKKSKIVKSGLSSSTTSSVPSTSNGKSAKTNKIISSLASSNDSKPSTSYRKSAKTNKIKNTSLVSPKPSTSIGKSAKPNKNTHLVSSKPSTSSARSNKTALISAIPSTSYGKSARPNKKIKTASPSARASTLRSKLRLRGRKNSREVKRPSRSSALKFKSPSVSKHESSDELSGSDPDTSDGTLSKLNSISMKLQNKIMTQDSTFSEVKEKSNSLDISDFDDVVGEFLKGKENPNNDSRALARRDGSSVVNNTFNNSTTAMNTPNLSDASLRERSAYVKLKKLKPVHESTPFPSQTSLQSTSRGSVSNKRRSSVSEDPLEVGPSTNKVARKSVSRHNKRLDRHSARTDPSVEVSDSSRYVDILSCGGDTESACASNLVNLSGSIKHTSRKRTGNNTSAADVTPLLTPSKEKPDNRKEESLTKSVGGMMSYLFGDNLAEECPNGFVVNVRLEVEKKKQEEKESETTDKSSSCCSGKSSEQCPCLQKVSDNTLVSVLKERVEKRRDLSVASKGALLASILNFMQDLEASPTPQTKSRPNIQNAKNSRATDEL